MTSATSPPGQEDRAHWIAVLARATHDEICTVTNELALPVPDVVKPPECGTLMIEARAGGSGQRFNAGEATVTRCVVRMGEWLGFACALGRDKRKALLCATLDALLQDPAHRRSLLDDVVAPLHATQLRRRALASRKAAATKVDFFTLVRGDG